MPQGSKTHDRILKLFMSRNQRQRMVPIQMRWLEREPFTKALSKWRRVTGIPDQRVSVLQSAILSIKDVPGDIGECGVRYGRSTLFLADAIDGARDLFVFDSFEGLSDADPEKDPGVESYKGDGKTRKFKNRNLSAVMERFANYPNIHVLQGWIPDRFPEVADKTFAFAHIDVDMYQPTLDSLHFFWDRLSPGGIVVCDDYGTAKFPGAQLAFDEFFADKREKPIELPTGQALVHKRSA